MEMFGDEANFKFCHEEKAEMEKIKNMIDKEMFE